MEELREPKIILPEPRKPEIILSKPLNKKIVRIELTKIWRDRDKVKGLIFNLMKGGYAAVTAGFVAFLFRSPFRKNESERFHKKNKFYKSRKFRFHKNKSRSGKFGNKGLKFRRSRNETFYKSRTSRILNTNPIKRNIAVKEEIHAAQKNTCTTQHEGMHLHQRDTTIILFYFNFS